MPPSTPFSDMGCSVARTLDVIGDRWTPMVLRDVAFGITRFDRIQANLGVSRKVLAQRLASLVDDGILQRVAYQERPARYDYFLTEKGADLALVLVALQAWGDKWVFGDEGPSVVWRHEGCGQLTTAQISCSCCGEPLRVGEAIPFVGPSPRFGPGSTALPAAIARIHELAGVTPE